MTDPDADAPSDGEARYPGVWRTAVAVMTMAALGALLWWAVATTR